MRISIDTVGGKSQRQPVNVAIFDIVVFFGCIRRRRIWTKKVAAEMLWFRSGCLSVVD
jgi:hypothetical protein